MNAVLSHLYDCFFANKLSLNINKIECVLFHKAKSKGNLSLLLADLFINDVKQTCKTHVKFQRVFEFFLKQFVF